MGRFVSRILFVHDLLDFKAGGAVRVILNLLSAMDAQRFDLHLGTPRSKEPTPAEFRELGAELHELPPLEQTSDRSLRGILKTLGELLRLNLAMLALLRRCRPDFVYVHSVTSMHFAVLPAWLLRVPLVYHEHGLASLRSRSLWDYALPTLIRRSAHVICIASTIRDETIATGVPPERVTTVPNGIEEVPVPPRLPGEAALGGAGGEPFSVVQIANLLRWKGHATLIRAAAEARQEVPELRICFYGRSLSAEFDEELRLLSRELGVGDIVEFGGYRPGIAELLGGFDCLVVASDSEPFGLVLLEGMRAGVPVIGTRAGGVPEIVTDGHDGLLFEPGDSSQLAQHFVRLARDRHLARRLAENGLVTLAERFSVPAQARGVEAVFEGLAASRPPGPTRSP